MTADTLPASGPEKEKRHWFRKATRRATSGVELIPKKKIPLVNGKHVHFRTFQMLVWSAITGAVFAAFVAGLYYLPLETTLVVKHWWDNLFHSPSWVIYRHTSFRDQLEPVAATLGIMTLLCKPKYWNTRVSTWRIFVTPFVVLVLGIGLSLAATWFLNFGLPHVWHRAPHPASTWEVLIAGVLIAKVCHRVWAPVGATVNGILLDVSVDAAKIRSRVPLWVKLPLAPPVIRERFSWIYEHDDVITERNSHRFWVVLGVMVFVLVAIVGFIAHYYIGKGHYVPYLVPGH